MSKRLTRDDRRKIVRQMLAHRFGTTVLEMARREVELARQVRLDTLGEKNIALMESLPEGWLEERNVIRVNAGGQYHQPRMRIFSSSSYGSGDWYVSVEHGVPLRVPYDLKWRSYDADHPRAVELNAWANDVETMVKQIREAGDKALATLDRFTSVPKLLKAWPEIEPFVDIAASEAKTNLPAIPTPCALATRRTTPRSWRGAWVATTRSEAMAG